MQGAWVQSLVGEPMIPYAAWQAQNKGKKKKDNCELTFSTTVLVSYIAERL